jgi:BirA family biotin operon repressor/biotin-[acetyl-CoA-carboxylase] ligase
LTFSVLRLLSDGAFHSGEAMAGRLDVSRASVWNALRVLDEQGIAVNKVRGRGYRLPDPVDFLDAKRVNAVLGDKAGRFQLELHDVVPSTNSLLLEKAAGDAAHGCCIAAEMQLRGRGRRGRPWHAGLGEGLTFSVLWRFNQGPGALGGLSLAVGLALVRALRAAGLADVALKWPNDVLCHYRKLAGVLIEVQGDMLGPSAAVIGVGLNVKLSASTRDEIDQAVVDMHSLTGRRPDRSLLLGALLAELAAVLQVFDEEGFAGLREEWQAFHAYHGKAVRVMLPAGQCHEGRVSGVSDDGSLLLETACGRLCFTSGEISLRLG